MSFHVDNLIDCDNELRKFNRLSLDEASKIIWKGLIKKPTRSRQECVEYWKYLGLHNMDFLRWVLGGAIIEDLRN